MSKKVSAMVKPALFVSAAVAALALAATAREAGDAPISTAPTTAPTTAQDTAPNTLAGEPRRAAQAARDAAQDAAISAVTMRVSALERDRPSTAPPPAPAPAVEPNTADGRPIMQLSLARWSLDSPADVFINHARAVGARWFAEGEGRERLEFDALWAMGAIDRDTLMPLFIPDGYDRLTLPAFRRRQQDDPKNWDGRWLVLYEGAGRVVVEGAGRRTARYDDGRIEFFVDQPYNTRVSFYDLEEGGLKRFAFLRADHEARHAAGEIFTPRFLAVAGQYKILRAMDALDTNISPINKAGQEAPHSAANWAFYEEYNDAGVPMRPPLQAMFDLAIAADAALWVNAPGGLGAPSEPWRDHQWTARDGDGVRKMAAANAEAIIESAEWDRWAAAFVEALTASGYPAHRTVYLELANEVWNNANPFWHMTNYYRGVNDWLETQGVAPEGARPKIAHGYASARMQVAVTRALEAAGREQEIVFVLGVQNANAWTAKGVIAGYLAYFEKAGLAPEPWKAHAGVSSAPYYRGAFEWKTSPVRASSEAAFVDAVLARIKQDGPGFADEIADWYVGPARRANIAWAMARRSDIEAEARRNAIAFIGDYEGGYHDRPPKALRDNKTFQRWYFDTFMDGPAGERVAKAWIEQSRAQNPDAIISNYGSFGRRSVQYPWIDGVHGEDTGRRRALAPYLRESR